MFQTTFFPCQLLQSGHLSSKFLPLQLFYRQFPSQYGIRYITDSIDDFTWCNFNVITSLLLVARSQKAQYDLYIHAIFLNGVEIIRFCCRSQFLVNTDFPDNLLANTPIEKGDTKHSSITAKQIIICFYL